MTVNPNIGRVLEGKYEIIRVLGSGGMGEVYEAKHRLINRRLAVKLLHQEYAREDEVVFRFQREAKASAAIGHDHIVEITDMGVTDTGELFIVMEYLDGRDLETVLEREKPLSATRACHIMIQVLSALEAAHAKGIVHRDLKPANVFLTSHSGIQDYVKLVDFGISKVRTTEEGLTRGLTRTGVLLGTPSYMSPEQALAETNITPATDLFSAGVILYEMLTGALPFDASSLAQLLVAIIEAEPSAPSTLRPDIPPELAVTVLRAMEKTPQSRFADAASFRRALTPFSPDTPVLTGLATTRLSERAAEVVKEFSLNSPGTPDHAGTSGSVLAATTPLELVSTTPSRPKRKWPLTAGLLVGTIATIAFLVTIALKMDDNNASSQPSFVPLTASAPESIATPPLSKSIASSNSNAQASSKSVTTPAEIQLRASVKPADADVFLDGRMLGRGSLQVRLPADGKTHLVVFRSVGHKEHSEEVVLDGDITLNVRLERQRSQERRERSRSGANRAQPSQNEEASEEKSASRSAEVIITEKPTAAPEQDAKRQDGRIIDESAPW